jgi:hypothetical protein
MEHPDIARWRMRSQHLWGRSLGAPEEVVGRLGAMQAQEYAFAKWAVAQRAKGVDDAAMERAVAEGTILRTHVLRPTWHFVLPADIRWMLALTGPRVTTKTAGRHRELGLDGRTFAKSNRMLADAVRGGRHRTRKELAEVLERRGVDTAGQRMPYFLMQAELDAVLCSGAPRGKQQTYALLDERAPGATTLDRDDALAELVRRYFTAHGPATVKDFAWWSGLTMADGRRGLDMVGGVIEPLTVDSRTYSFAAGSRRGRARPTALDLVHVYDEIAVSYSESRDVVQGSVRTPVLLAGPAMHPVLHDGQVLGRWRRVLGKSSVELEIELGRRLDATATRALEAAARRYGRFLGTRAEVVRTHVARR